VISGQSTPTSGGRRLRRLSETLQQTMTRYGYELVETPIVQPAELFLTKAGDRLVTRLFTFERNGKQLALRPEFTATAAYDYVNQKQQRGDIARWQYNGPVFIDENGLSDLDTPQFSIGAELIGLPGPMAEAEIMAMAVDGLNAAGVHQWQLTIGHVGLMRRLLQRYHLDSRTQRILLSSLSDLKAQGKQIVLDRLSHLMLRPENREEGILQIEDGSAAVNTQQMLDALLDATQRNITMGGRSRHDIVRRLLQKRQRSASYDQIVAAVDFLATWGEIDLTPSDAFAAIETHIGDDVEARALLTDWKRVVALLEAAGVPATKIRIQPDLARSWDYYTGIVFEIYAASGEHLAGGGRYDELTALVGGTGDVPAAGFVYYPAQIIQANGSQPAPLAPAFVISADPTQQTDALLWARQLRSSGHTVILQDTMHTAGDSATITADGALQWKNQTYTSDHIDQLRTDIERA
jgi:histidyl-tRNA synthetase